VCSSDLREYMREGESMTIERNREGAGII